MYANRTKPAIPLRGDDMGGRLIANVDTKSSRRNKGAQLISARAL